MASWSTGEKDGAGRRPVFSLGVACFLGKAAVAGGELVRDRPLARARPELLRGKGDGMSV